MSVKIRVSIPVTVRSQDPKPKKNQLISYCNTVCVPAQKRRGVEGKQHYHFTLGSFTLNATYTEILRLFMGFSYGGLITIFITDVGKYTVGRLRPHFLSICKPPPALISNCSHNYILGDVCTGDPDRLREGRLSFPSGHASFSGTP